MAFASSPDLAISGNHALATQRIVWLLVILFAGGIVRVYELANKPLKIDEVWSVEIATGRGSLHQHLPFNQVISPPPFFSLQDAPSFWKIWTHMQVTHPPVYEIILRLWENVLGDSDYQGRLLSVIASLISITIFFDVVFLQAGLAPAVWASLLMSFAGPQLEYARLIRSYAILTAFGLLIVNIIVRIQSLGPTRWRWTLLWIAIFSTLMTHYFCIGALAGVWVFCWWQLRAYRRTITLIFLFAGLTFAVIWGPFMWQQRLLFSTDDQSTQFLTSGLDHHFLRTCFRLGVVPSGLFFSNPSWIDNPCALAGACLIGIGFVPRLHRKNSWLLLWGLWLLGVVMVVTALDLFRHTDHLYFVRYTLLAGPAVYAILPCVISDRPRLMHGICAIVLFACLWNVPLIVQAAGGDPRHLLQPTATPSDLLLAATVLGHESGSEDQLLCLSRYLPVGSCPVGILNRPADESVLAKARQSRFIFLITQTAEYPPYLPGATVLRSQSYNGFGYIWTLEMTKQPR